ncbi:MAG: lipopolysaccharide biosynthesis protein [Lachnospiraceae bacterium]|nr:lipopolysaccharide biosynthesis protein [Lachnospiraceae bacterium]
MGTGTERAKKSARNIVYNMAYQILSILLKFISRTVFIRTLGVEYLGINGLFSEFLQLLSMADLGINTAMIFSLYKPLAEEDETHVTQLLNLYKRIYMVIALVITGIGVGVLPWLGLIVNTSKTIPHLRIYYLLYLANTVSSYLVVYRTAILTADQRNYLISRNNAIFDTLATIAGILELVLLKKYMLYLMLQVAFTYMKNFRCSHIAKTEYPYILEKCSPLPEEERKSIFANIRSVFIYKISSTLVTSTDNTLMSVMVSTAAVGYYSNYSMVTANILTFINIIFQQTISSIGNLVIEHDRKKNYRVFSVMQQISFLLGTISITCVYALMNDFITVWLGERFVLEPLVVFAIVLNMYFSAVLMPIWAYRDATGIYRQTKYVMLATAIVNLAASILLGRVLGIAGILLATSLARLSTYFWYEPKLLFGQYFGIGVRHYYRNIALNLGFTGVLCLLMRFAFDRFVPGGWGMLIVKAVFVGLAAAALTVLAYFRAPAFKETVGIAERLFKGKLRRGKR